MNRVFPRTRLGAQIHAWRWSRVCRIWTLCQSAFIFFLDYLTTVPRQAHAKRTKTRLQSEAKEA